LRFTANWRNNRPDELFIINNLNYLINYLIFYKYSETK